MALLFENNATSTLASGIGTGDTSISVQAGHGARFPNPSGGDTFRCTLVDSSNNIEIVDCTARSTDTLTVVRAQEGTTAKAYSSGDRIDLRVTKETLETFTQVIEDLAVDKGTNYTTVRADYGVTINATAAVTIDLGDAATMTANYIVTVKNSHTANITVGRQTGTDTIDGVAGNDTLIPGEAITYITNAAANGYFRKINYQDPIPAGTLMLFQQTAAPVGWTKQTTHNDKALRVVTGAAGSGGTVVFSTVFGITATDSHTLTASEMPVHNHSLNLTDYGGNSPGANSGWSADPTTQGTTNRTVTNAGSGNGHTHSIDLRVQYVDLIIASKDG